MANATTDEHALPPPIPVAAPTDELLTLWIIGGVCVLAGCILVLRTIVGHWHYWNHPKVQHYYVRLLYVMPVYGLTALISLIFPLTSATSVLVRQSMQGFLAYNFVDLLIAYFAPHETEERRIEVLGRVLANLDPVRAAPPCCLIGTVKPGLHFVKDGMVLRVKTMAIVLPLLALVGEYFSAYRIYGFGANDTGRAFFYLNLVSVLATMYGLSAVFVGYQVVGEMLPMTKLQNLTTHLVLGPLVFQEVIISVLAATGNVSPMFGLPDVPSSVGALINFLLCVECLLVGFLFTKAYSYMPFVELEGDTHAFHAEWVKLPDGRRFSVVGELEEVGKARQSIVSSHSARVRKSVAITERVAGAAVIAEEDKPASPTAGSGAETGLVADRV